MSFQFTPLTERKAITMDYEEYLKLEKKANMLETVIADIISSKSLNALQNKYKALIGETDKGGN